MAKFPKRGMRNAATKPKQYPERSKNVSRKTIAKRGHAAPSGQAMVRTLVGPNTVVATQVETHDPFAREKSEVYSDAVQVCEKMGTHSYESTQPPAQ